MGLYEPSGWEQENLSLKGQSSMFPLELSCDQEQGVRETPPPPLNPRAREFRPVRRAAAVAANILRIAEEEAVELTLY